MRSEIRDTRNITRTNTWTLDPVQAAIYKLIKDPCTLKSIMASLKDSEYASLSTERVQNLLDKFIDQALAVKEKNTYLGLALRKNTLKPAVKKRWTI
jgi:hypothetical protein